MKKRNEATLIMIINSACKVLVFVLITFVALTGCGGGDGGGGTSASSSSQNSEDPSFNFDPNVLIAGQTAYDQHCEWCHDNDNQPGLDGNGNPAIIVSKFASPSALAQYIVGNMPKNDVSACIGECADAIADFIFNGYRTAVDGESDDGAVFDPNIPRPAQGSIVAYPKTIHRLNRSEYNNTVQTLFNTELAPADLFPIDDFGYGFNNNADVLSVSQTHIEQYVRAADALIAEAFGEPQENVDLSFEAEAIGSEVGIAAGDHWNLFSNGGILFSFELASAGEYTLEVIAGQDAAGDDPANMRLSINGQLAIDIDVTAPGDQMAPHEINWPLQQGQNTVFVEFTNDYWEENQADRNLRVDQLNIRSQFESSNSEPKDLSWLQCEEGHSNEECVRDVISQFGLVAWRRPVTTNETEKLAQLYQSSVASGDVHSLALRQVVKAILLSPHFLFRAEIDPDLDSIAPRLLTSYELASRLSFFAWSQAPDKILLDLAANNTLVEDDILRTQVIRMLNDPRSESLVENFAAQWLKFDKIIDATPDQEKFPEYSPELQNAMRQETRLFISDLIKQNAPIDALFSANYTFIDAQLAQHYGVEDFEGQDFKKHVWSSTETRRGLLGHASILTSTSHPTSTSPVLRGKWVLENLLCDEPPPPPPGVENIAISPDLTGLSTREKFEMHRDTDTVCFTCHKLMDPIGFALEHFGPTGRWRADDNGEDIITAGELPSGESISGAIELANVLSDSYRLPMCTVSHLMTFALGRGVEALGGELEKPDYPVVYDIYQKTAENGYRIRDIIIEIVLSDAFRQRVGANVKAEDAE